jgi:hypothetical protein
VKQNKMPFRDNIDFCCLALTGPHLDVHGTTTLLPELSITDSTSHIDLDFWAEWLGTLQTDSFRRSSLVIAAERYALDAGGNYQARATIERRVRLVHYALVLMGCGYNSDVLMVGGNTASGHLHLGPMQLGLTPCKRPQYRKPKRITAQDLKRAATMLVSLERAYDHAPGPEYRRIRKGFNSWIQGVESQDPAQALHSFVRAAEAIIRPTTTTRTQRAITKTFVARGQTFTGHSIRNKRLLRQFYDLRSCIEHVKNIEPALHKPRNVPKDEAFAFRVLQAEILASTIYSRIFTSDALREQLRSESRVEGFWRRRDGGRRMLWGRSIDLSAAADREFLSSSGPLDLL